MNDLTGLADVAATGGTRVFLSSGFGLNALVSMLDQTGRFKVTQSPDCFHQQQQESHYRFGPGNPGPRQYLRPFIERSGKSLVTFGPNRAFSTRKLRSQLEVVPLINSEKEVTLDILQKLDSLAVLPRNR